MPEKRATRMSRSGDNARRRGHTMETFRGALLELRAENSAFFFSPPGLSRCVGKRLKKIYIYGAAKLRT